MMQADRLARRIFNKVYGKPSWNVHRGVGSMIAFEFWKPISFLIWEGIDKQVPTMMASHHQCGVFRSPDGYWFNLRNDGKYSYHHDNTLPDKMRWLHFARADENKK